MFGVLQRKMVGKNLVFGLAFVLAGVMIASFAFAQENPDLAPFNASVGLANAAPTIETIVNVSEVESDQDVGTEDFFVQPISGVVAPTVGVNVTFVVLDPDQPDDLPGNGTASAINVGTNVDVNVTGPSGSSVSATACQTVPIAGEALRIRYSCQLSMPYYFETGTYDVGVFIQDESGSPDYLVELDNFTYETVTEFAVDVPATNVVWGGITLSAGDQPADGGNLVLENFGNQNIVDFTLNATNLTGVNLGASSQLGAAGFSASASTGAGSPDTECDVPTSATALIHGVDITVSGVNLNFGSGSTSDVYFCVYQALSPSHVIGSQDSNYASNNGVAGTFAPGDSWEVANVP